jgi:hypothetical protein
MSKFILFEGYAICFFVRAFSTNEKCSFADFEELAQAGKFPTAMLAVDRLCRLWVGEIKRHEMLRNPFPDAFEVKHHMVLGDEPAKVLAKLSEEFGRFGWGIQDLQTGVIADEDRARHKKSLEKTG